ncbi:unnamed protein product [Bursaphelenchus okinawaensis]|uniref:LIM zinc-binding domain-containing protein n=1 Tax=Bursaphelenchus okinawaensis TaxID=465554 RepID=A0A811LMD9_9BILA|nr:unnamed protein product [Bursaphelenchus okinawaensis]CAG9124106.1 unnamed protein product [Bursaphelenchus okinawaensis]
MVEKQAGSPSASSSAEPPSQIHQLAQNDELKNTAGTSEEQSQGQMPENRQLHSCLECNEPIRDRFLFKVLENSYHETCLKCADCQISFQHSCYARNGRIFCRQHFFRRFGPKCSKCHELIQEHDLIRKANSHVYHADCFKCVVCENELNTGEQFYLIPMDGRLVCRTDYENSNKGG